MFFLVYSSPFPLPKPANIRDGLVDEGLKEVREEEKGVQESSEMNIYVPYIS